MKWKKKEKEELKTTRKSLKQFYRLWFEYLILSQQKYKWSKKEKEFYIEWGDVNSYKNFDDWWKDKGSIFVGSIKVERGVRNNNDSINLNIPLTQPLTTSIKQIRIIVNSEIRRRLDEIYKRELKESEVTNKLKIPSQKFPIPKQPKYETIQNDLIVYRDVYLKRKSKVINMDMINDCINHFKNRKINKNIPQLLKESDDEMSMIRRVRRSIDRVEKGLKRVKEGKFVR